MIREEDMKVHHYMLFDDIRTAIIDDDIWFVGEDILKNLNLKDYKKIAPSELTFKEVYDKNKEVFVHYILISKQGIYELMTQNKFREFKDWIEEIYKKEMEESIW